jgi:uncharacterized HAD superfamily protein
MKTISLNDGTTLFITKVGEYIVYKHEKFTNESDIWLTKWFETNQPLTKKELYEWLKTPHTLFVYKSGFNYPGRCTTVL